MKRFIPQWPTAIVFLMWMVDSAIHAPVPAVNEPQYLGKAKHLWDASWAAGDFFLNSSNPHWAFYAAIGWLTLFLPLEAVAWVGRIVGYALLAFGWTRLARSLLSSSILAIPAAGIFLLCASIGNFSGEWIIGGIEGKVFSYGCLLAGIAAWLEARPVPALAWLGGALAFHPIVGGWGIGCIAVVEVLARLRSGRWKPESPKHAAIGVGLLLLFSLPGLVPALISLFSPTEHAARATYIQVFVRLKHHLDPTTFSPIAWAAYAGMLLACGVKWSLLLGRRSSDESPTRHRRFAGFVMMTVVIALAGSIIGWHAPGASWTMPLRDLRGFLLKFYPFRLADVFIPIAFALITSAWICIPWRRERQRPLGRTLGVGIIALGVALMIPAPDANPTGMSPTRRADWIAVAKWTSHHTPPGTVIVIPTHHWGFRWYSDRAIYVSYKDAPQDAAGLLEWERRLAVIRRWWESTDGLYDHEDLARLQEATKAGYLVTRASPLRFDTPPVYDNGSYRVYQLPKRPPTASTTRRQRPIVSAKIAGVSDCGPSLIARGGS